MDVVDFSPQICSPLTQSHKNAFIWKNIEHAEFEDPAWQLQTSSVQAPGQCSLLAVNGESRLSWLEKVSLFILCHFYNVYFSPPHFSQVMVKYIWRIQKDSPTVVWRVIQFLNTLSSHELCSLLKNTYKIVPVVKDFSLIILQKVQSSDKIFKAKYCWTDCWWGIRFVLWKVTNSLQVLC